MRKLITSVVLGMALLAASSPTFAHHGFEVTFDTAHPITKTGPVTSLRWTNPHCYLFFDAKDDQGDIENWGIEMTNPRALARVGLSKEMFPEGKIVTVTFSPARTRTNRGLVQKVKIGGKLVFDSKWLWGGI